MNDESAAIHPPHEIFYIESMLFNSMSAIRSFAKLNSAFEKLPRTPTLEDFDQLPRK